MRYLLLCVLLFAGCDNPVAVESKRLATKEERQWAAEVYAEVADCLGVRPYHHVARYWVADRVEYGGVDVGGAQSGNSLYVVGDDLYDAFTLSHEIIHHALWKSTGDSDPNHLRRAWDRCTLSAF